MGFSMNKLKIFGFSLLGIVVLFYLSFLFILPNAINLNKFKPEIQKIAKEVANLSVDFENAKIITTPLLAAGIKTDNISIKLPDNSTLFEASNFKTRIALPSLFLLTVKISALEIHNPKINLEIRNGEQFKVVELVEEILNKGKEQKFEQEEIKEEKKSWFNPNWIKIKIPKILITNYDITIDDIKTKHYLKLKGEELTLGYFNGKTVKLKTTAELFSDKNKNITANLDIDSFLPPPAPPLDKEDDPAERIDIPFVNPVEMYRNYDLKANIDSKLKIRNFKNGINSFGYFNIEDITLKVSHLNLPKSYLRAKTRRQNVFLDTNIFTAPEQNISLLGKLNYGKRPRMDMAIKTAEIKFNDVVILAKAFLDSLSIYNELDKITATGFLKADCNIKTNFKRLKSNGLVVVKNGGLNVKNLGKVISDANINIYLDNNLLDIKNSSLYVNNSPILIDGRIDKKSIADISIKAEKIPLPTLFSAFAPKDIRNAYNFKSGDLSFEARVFGKLKRAAASLTAGLNNFYFADKLNNFALQNEKFASSFNLKGAKLEGKIENNNFAILLPKTKSKLFSDKFEVEIIDKNIVIKENKLNLNNNSTIAYSGKIEDYEKLKSILFETKGNFATNDLVQIIGDEFKPFIHYSGTIPLVLNFVGDKKKQTLNIEAIANKDNFITPVDYDELKNKETILSSTIDFKANRIKIKDTGLKIKNIQKDKRGNETITYTPISNVEGTIEGDRINLIKIIIPNAMHGKIYAFPNSNYELTGRAFVFGEMVAPRVRGGFRISNLSIPELLINLKKFELKFRGHEGEINVEDLVLNGSDIQNKTTFSILPAPIFSILNCVVESKYFNLDKVMVVSEKAMKYVPTSSAPTTSQTTADIPAEIKRGNINFKRITTGNINLFNTVSDISLKNNVFNLENLKTRAFKGDIKGNIGVNLITMFLDIDVNGKNVDVDRLMRDACAMKDTLSGSANFNADLTLSGVTLEEQMKSLKGEVDFTVNKGQFGPFAKIENLILAENIRESQFFQTAIGSILSGLLTIDTTHFETLKGYITFNDGICHLEPITSLGDILSLHIFGDFDLLKNHADMKVRARMASLVSNLLGPLGAINPANLLNSAASLTPITAKAFSIFCEMVPESELATLPSFANAYVDNAATKFQIVVRGDVAKPLTLVKSFKWLAGEAEYQTAIDFVNSIPEPLEGSTATTVEELIKENEAYKKSLKYKWDKLFDEEK